MEETRVLPVRERTIRPELKLPKGMLYYIFLEVNNREAFAIFAENAQDALEIAREYSTDRVVQVQVTDSREISQGYVDLYTIRLGRNNG